MKAPTIHAIRRSLRRRMWSPILAPHHPISYAGAGIQERSDLALIAMPLSHVGAHRGDTRTSGGVVPHPQSNLSFPRKAWRVRALVPIFWQLQELGPRESGMTPLFLFHGIE